MTGCYYADADSDDAHADPVDDNPDVIYTHDADAENTDANDGDANNTESGDQC